MIYTSGRREHTGLLNISLLHAGATPVGILAIFSRHPGTPLSVKGSGIGTAEVSVTPIISTSTAEGGLISTRRIGDSVRVGKVICGDDAISVFVRKATGSYIEH